MIILNPWWKNKNVSKGAFGTVLICPHCQVSDKNKSLGWVSPLRIRMQCTACKKTFQYDISNNPNIVRQELARPSK